MSFLTELADYLEDEGLGYFTPDNDEDQTIFIGSLPNSPDSCCSLQEYGGLPTVQGFGVDGSGNSIAYETPAVQLIFRGAPYDYEGPREQARLAYLAMLRIQAETLGSTFYHHVTALSPPFLIRRDENMRMILGCNYRIEKTHS